MAEEAKQYHRISLEEINPYFGRELEATVYLLGSPGAGKTKFMKRLMNETGGKLVIESGIFDLFQQYVIEFVKRKRESGYKGEINNFFVRDDSARTGYSKDPDFQLPEIDGLKIGYCMMSSIPLDKTLDEVANDSPRTFGKGQEAVCKNLPYSGWGAYHYRTSLDDRIVSGGKSGFPDWLFIPRKNEKYIQIISFPGHNRIEFFFKNQSVPEIPEPSSSIYLVDPNIDQFYRPENRGIYKNYALAQAHLHLADVLDLENKDVPVSWLLSKTTSEQLAKNQKKAARKYSLKSLKGNLSEIANRVMNLDGFDSFNSSSEIIMQALENSIKR
jgi:hypothetical protein